MCKNHPYIPSPRKMPLLTTIIFLMCISNGGYWCILLRFLSISSSAISSKATIGRNLIRAHRDRGRCSRGTPPLQIPSNRAIPYTTDRKESAMPDFDCLRCGTAMHFVGQHKLQLGRTSWIFGDLPNLMAGALDVSIMACPACGKRSPAQRQRPRPTPAPVPEVRLCPRFRLPQMSPVRLCLHRRGRAVRIFKRRTCYERLHP